jgi:hypothetical protein
MAQQSNNPKKSTPAPNPDTKSGAAPEKASDAKTTGAVTEPNGQTFTPDEDHPSVTAPLDVEKDGPQTVYADESGNEVTVESPGDPGQTIGGGRECVVPDSDPTPHNGRAVPGSKVCSAHAMHYDNNGRPRVAGEHGVLNGDANLIAKIGEVVDHPETKEQEA